jgi:hypothetical protein
MAQEAAAPARPAGPTRLVYFDDMGALRYSATVLSVHQVFPFPPLLLRRRREILCWTWPKLSSGCPQEDGGRVAVVLDATVFHPQGGGQPADTGVISAGGARFLVEDVRAKDGVVRIRGFWLSATKAANLFTNHEIVTGVLFFLLLAMPLSSCDWHPPPRFSTMEDLRARNKDVGLDLKRGKPLAWRSTQNGAALIQGDAI